MILCIAIVRQYLSQYIVDILDIRISQYVLDNVLNSKQVTRGETIWVNVILHVV